MKSFLPLAIVAILLAGCCGNKNNEPAPATQPVAASATSAWQSFGEPTSDLPQVQLAGVLADPSAFAGKPIEISGTIIEVCQHAGCWVRIADPAAAQESVFVKFTCPIEGRLIPLEAVGKPALVQGEIVVEEIDEMEARHVAIEAGKSPEEVDAIVGPQKVIRVSSPAARVRV